MGDVINLEEIGFSFAVETIQEEYASIETYLVNWSGETGEKEKTRIEMVPCTALQSIDLPIVSQYSAIRGGVSSLDDTRYICPDPAMKLFVQGDYLSEKFVYIEVILKRCSEKKCAEYLTLEK